MKKFPVSFSRLSTFEQCPQKFDYLYVTKSVIDAGNEITDYGTRVHEALELYGRALVEGGDAAAAAIVSLEGNVEARKWKGLVDRIVRKDGEKYFEHQMALNPDKQPCDWFAADVWLRGIADVLVVDGDTAWCVDWKTGKPKENPTQLQLFAALIFIHFPEVQTVKTSFVWLNYDDMSDATYTRRMLPHIWMALDPRFTALQDAVDLGVFKAKPSGLCGWCAAKDICPDRRKR